MSEQDEPPGGMPQSLRDKAYEAIKRRIISLEYKPGSFMTEVQIKDDIGIGRTPVHQALERLSLEGFVTIISRKGVVVAPISFKEIGFLTEARDLIEPRVAGLAARNASDDEIRRLKKIVEKARGLRPYDTEQLMQLDREFHQLLAAASRNPVLGPIARNIHERLLRFWYVSPNDTAARVAVAQEHEEMVAAIAARDEARAEAVMRQHVRRFNGPQIAQKASAF